MRLKVEQDKLELIKSDNKNNLTYERLKKSLFMGMLKYIPIYFVLLSIMDLKPNNKESASLAFVVIFFPILSEFILRIMIINSVLNYDIKVRPNEITEFEEKYLISRFSKIRIEKEYVDGRDGYITSEKFDGINEEIVFYNDIRSISYNTISKKVTLKVNRFQKNYTDLDSKFTRKNIASNIRDTIFYYMIYNISTEEFLKNLSEKTGLDINYVNVLEELYYNASYLDFNSTSKRHMEV